jgi:NodT family efflux transporter outer membrane factor (OMF) lipoprotein
MKRLAVTLLLASMLAACAPSFAAAPVASAAQRPQREWWSRYEDAQLDALIAEALAGSPSVRIADARLRRARSFQDSARGALSPQVAMDGSVSLQKHSYNDLTPREMTPSGWNDYGRAALNFSWELDFWGRNRAALAAATSDAAAASADSDQARLVIASAIASGYAELARLYSALDTANAARALLGKTAGLFAQRFDHGLETRGSVRQADARRAGAEADVLMLEELILLQKNQLAALVGAGPERGDAIVRPGVDFARSFELPATLAADLIGRRPDIAAARLRAEAAAERISATRAQFYPNVNLAALIGVQSAGLEVLTASGSDMGSVGPAISLPIFNGGRLRAQLRGAESEYAEAVASYDQALTQALQEVADAMVSLRALGPRLDRMEEAVAAAREAWRVQGNRYEGGLATYLEVLSAEDYLLANLRTQTDLRSRAMSLDVALNRALGGGYPD